MSGFKTNARRRRPSISVDLLIPNHRLIIEAAGFGHRLPRDGARDWLTARGFRVLRLGNRDVQTNLPGCLDPVAAESPQH
jgi:very-short-patch-repair endonuclease